MSRWPHYLLEDRSITRSKRLNVAAGRDSARSRPTEQQQVFAEANRCCSGPSKFLVGALVALLGVAAATGCGDDAVPEAEDGAGTSDVGAVADTAGVADGGGQADAAADAVSTADAGTPTLQKGIWTQLSVPGDPNLSLHSVSTDGPGRALAAGSNGTILQYDGLQWKVASAGKFPTLHGVSIAPGGGRAFAVGLGGTIVQTAGTDGKLSSNWGPPGGCAQPKDCDDGDLCTADSCESGICSHLPSGASGCCGGAAFADTFDKGLGLWQVSDLHPSPDGGIVWNAAGMLGKDGGQRWTSPPNAAYFGRTDSPCEEGTGMCPTFDNGKAVGSTMVSPTFTLPQAAQIQLSFQILLDVGSGNFDQLQIWAAQPSGAKELLWDKQKKVPTGSTGGQFQPTTVDLTKFAGKALRLEITFNSLDKNNNAGEGVFLDDLVVSSVCAAPVTSSKAMTSGTLFGVWAAAEDNAWAVGEGGFTAHWDGQVWAQVSGGKALDLNGIGGSAHFGLVAGEKGYSALIGPGGAIKALASVTNKKLVATAVRESADGKTVEEAMAVGPLGTVLHWQDGVWQVEAASIMAGQDLRGVAALGDGTWAAVSSSGVVWERNKAGTWLKAATVGLPLNGVTAAGNFGGFAVGSFGALAVRKGGAWQVSSLGADSALAVWAADADNAWAVGENGIAWRLENGQWSQALTSTSVHLNAVWGAAPDDVFAAGLLSTIVHFNGAEWSSMSAPPGMDWRGIWGTSTTDVYAVGTGGAVAHWNGADWTLLVQPVATTLRAVWGLGGGDVWAVGEKGGIYHSTGAGWQATPIEPYQPDPEQKAYEVKSTLLAVWGAKTDDVWASGEPDGDGRGVLVHWDGTSWHYLPALQDLPKTIRAMWGFDGEHVLLAGTQGTVLQLAGKSAEIVQLSSGTIATLFGVAPWGKDAVLVGDIGVVLRYTPAGKQ